jgi:FkbM family methyltransferase
MTSILQRARTHSASAVLRGRLVSESARFAARELRRSRAAHVYRIRENGLRVLLAHGTPDVLTLDQAFHQHVYEPPPAALAALQALDRPLRALDLGANIGLWGLWLHGRLAVEHVTGLEPDPENAAKHARQIALNRLEGSWDLVQAAATCAEGPVTFTTGHATTGHIADDGEPGASVEGRDVFALLDGIDLLKIDIEGAEWPMRADPRWPGLRAPVAMLEYHPHGAPSADPESDAQRALQEAGYSTLPMHGAPNGTGVVWGWRS